MRLAPSRSTVFRLLAFPHRAVRALLGLCSFLVLDSDGGSFFLLTKRIDATVSRKRGWYRIRRGGNGTAIPYVPRMPPRLTSVKISDVKKALPLAKKLAVAVDVNKDKRVNSEEIARVKVRDQFVARDLLNRALSNSTWPDGSDASPARLAAEFDGAIRSLEKADKNGDGVVTGAELSKASLLAKALAAFAAEHGDDQVADFEIKPYEKPGTRAWADLAKQEYYDVGRSGGGQPRFGTALIIKREDLSPALRSKYDAFRAAHPTGTLEASSYKLNGAPAYYFHVKQDTRVDVQVLDAKAKPLSEGVFTGSRTDWSKPWKAKWTDA